jgi:prepilin peptidase CpaA
MYDIIPPEVFGMDILTSDPMWLPVAAALATSLLATAADVKTLQIRNTLTVPLCLTGLGFHLWLGGWEGVSLSVVGITVGFGCLIVPYMIGILGAGDVKLLMAMGAWLGGYHTALVALFGCLSLGVLAVVVMAKREGLSAVWFNLQLSVLRLQTIRRHLFGNREHLKDIRSMARDPNQRGNLIPFSVMLAMGTCVLVLVISAG